MVLVTGASGFVGQHLVRFLSGKGEPVRALYYKHPPSAELLQLANIEWVCCDMLDIGALEEAMQSITHIYHCAAVVSFNPRRKKEMLHFNVESTANLVNLALEKNVEKLVYVSSVAALGRSHQRDHEITETSDWEESKYNSVYGQSKYYAEMEVWRGVAEGLNAVIINPGIILGEGDWNEGSANIMKVVNKEFPFYTSGINAWVDIKDVVQAMYALMQSNISAERFITSAGNYSYRHIFNTMAKALNKKPPSIAVNRTMTDIVARFYLLKTMVFGGAATITPETSRNAHVAAYYNNTRLLNVLPDFSYTPVENTIARMAAAFRANGVKK